MENFSQRCRALRRERGISQAYLAETLGVSVQSVSNWECGNTMPDISQIVPLASVLSVSTDYLLGAGRDEARDKAELCAALDRIWTAYSVNTAENNADLLAYEAYRQYLVRYPLDEEVRCRCASAVLDYLTVTAERKKFDIPRDEWERRYAECARLFSYVCEHSTAPQLQLDARRGLVSLYLLKNEWAEAEKTAALLPEVCGLRAETLAHIAEKKNASSEARRYTELACREKLTDYVRALFYRAKALSDDPETEKETACAAWKEMQMAAERLTALFRDPSVLAVNAYEKNPYCYRITSFTACSCFLLNRGDVSGALDCAERAADIACEMVLWARTVCSDTLVLSDIRFFAEHTPGWCWKWAVTDGQNAMLNDERFRRMEQRVKETLQKKISQ